MKCALMTSLPRIMISGPKVNADSAEAYRLSFSYTNDRLRFVQASKTPMKFVLQSCQVSRTMLGAVRHDILHFSSRVLAPHRPQRTQFHLIA
jgi:hypothetical protein